MVKRLSDEVLVYDLETNEAHCLNRASALVWDECDGRKSAREIAGLLEAKGHEPFTVEMVWLALNQLERFSLLKERVELPVRAATLSRRELGKRLGLVGVASLPFILSIAAPVAASAATCGVPGSPCLTNARCCSGICMGGVCVCLDKDVPCANDAQCCSGRCGSALNKCLP